MKRTYVKPGIYVENFTLAQSVAAGGCGAVTGKPAHADIGSCGWEMGGVNVWLKAVSTPCQFTVDADTPWQGVCYNNPIDGQTIFTHS